MRGDAGAEQLVGAKAEHVEHRRVDLAQRTVDAGGDDGVVRALVTQRAVDQLGGERGVAPVEAATGLCLAQQCGQDEVGVGVALVHRPQCVEGELAYGVEPGSPVGRGALRGALRAAAVAAVTGLVVHEKRCSGRRLTGTGIWGGSRGLRVLRSRAFRVSLHVVAGGDTHAAGPVGG